MLVLITCQACATPLKVDTEAGHPKVKCPKCGSVVSVPQVDASGAKVPKRPYAPKTQQEKREPGPLFEYADETAPSAAPNPASPGTGAPEEIAPSLFENETAPAPSTPAGADQPKLFEYADETPGAGMNESPAAGTGGAAPEPAGQPLQYADTPAQAPAGTSAGPVEISAADIQPWSLAARPKKRSSWRREVTPGVVRVAVSAAAAGLVLGVISFGMKLVGGTKAGLFSLDKVPELLAVFVNLVLILVLLTKNGSAFETIQKLLWVSIVVVGIVFALVAWRNITGVRRLAEVIRLGFYVGIIVCMAICAKKTSGAYDFDTYFGKR